MWPTTTWNRGKSGTPGRGNEIWEGLRPLSFFSFAAPPHPRPGVAPAPTPYLRAVRAARPGRMSRPAVPARGYRPSACPLRRPYGRPRDQKECGGMKIARLARAAPRRALAPGGWWLSGPGSVGPGPPWAVAGLPRSVFAAARSAGGAAPPGQAQGSPGGRAWGPPSAPAAGMGAAPFPGPALWSSLAWSRAAAVPSRASPVAPGNGGRRQCVARRAGVPPLRRRGTAGGINAPGGRARV